MNKLLVSDFCSEDIDKTLQEAFDEGLLDSAPDTTSISKKYEISKRNTGDKITVGFKQLDENLGGFRAGCLYLVAGLEKSGKSSLVMSFTQNLLDQGLKVGYINTELDDSVFIDRMAALKNNLTFGEVEANQQYSQKWLEDYEKYFKYAGKNDIIDFSNNTMSFGNILSQSQIMLRKEVKVLIFDNLSTLFNNPPKGQEGWQYLAECMTKLNNFTSSNNIITICVIHTKEDGVYKESPDRVKNLIKDKEAQKIFTESITIVSKPSLKDVYGGGMVKNQVSGAAILVWRPYQKFDSNEYNRMSQLIVDSSRFSRNFSVMMDFDGSKYLFTEKDPNAVLYGSINSSIED